MSAVDEMLSMPRRRKMRRFLNNEHGAFERFGKVRGNLRVALDERNLIAFSEQRARKVFANHSSTNDHAIH